MASILTKIDKTGRIVIPARVRKDLNLAIGADVVLSAEGGELRVYSRERALRRMQALAQSLVPRGSSVVDELIADRKKQAKRELER